MNMKKIQDGFESEFQKHAEYVARLECELEKARKAYPNWKEWVVIPFAAAIARLLNTKSWSVEGPYGIANTYNLFFIFKKARYLMKVRNGGHHGMLVVDLNTHTNDHPEGSIGARNDLNHPVTNAPARPTLKWAKKYIM